jgi:hypothetical protein
MSLAEIAQIAQSVSIVLAALFAVYGFDAWRREHVGKRRIELAEEVLSLFYQVRDAIADIRNPMGFGGEGSSRTPGKDERPEDKQALDSAYVLIERYRNHSELFSKLQSIRYRVMAQLGKEAAAPFDTLGQVVNKLIISAHRMARVNTESSWSHHTSEVEEKLHREMLEVCSIYYGTGGEDDPIAPLVDAAVAKVEASCRGVIDSHGTLYSVFNARIWKSGAYPLAQPPTRYGRRLGDQHDR